MTDDQLATILLQAYKQSTADKCTYRYISARGDILKGADIYNTQKQTIIATVRGIFE